MARSATFGSALPVELLTNLTLRELRGKFKRSALGWLWSVINPLSSILIYGVVFGIVLRVEPPVGDPSGLDSYAMFLVCALLPWNFLAAGLNGSAGSIVGNEGLVKKVYFPRWVLPASSVLSWLASYGVELLVLGVVLAVVGNVVLTSVPMLLVVIVIQTGFVFGLGMLLAGANAYFRDVQHFLGIALNLWFYSTPILIPASEIPETYEVLGVEVPLRDIFALNPMSAFVDAYRDLLYHQRGPTLSTMLEVTAWTIVVVVAGVLAFRRLEPRLAEEL
jgi:ABC-2 type transport system permease protein